MGMFFTKDVGDFYLGSSKVSEIYLGSTQVWPVGLPVGTIFNFDYTGSVQEIELPKGKYKLQCWGAQGGRSYASSSYTGSKGGYSEGVLTLTETTTLYVFVGGQGSYGSSSNQVNGGWNGGGASVGFASYDSGGTYGYSYPASGGGATDIATVTSTMSYSSGRTNRSSASLLSRCIVAGGGAGASYRKTEVSTTSSKWVTLGSRSGLTATAYIYGYDSSKWGYAATFDNLQDYYDINVGDTIRIICTGQSPNVEDYVVLQDYRSSGFVQEGQEITVSGGYRIQAVVGTYSTQVSGLSFRIEKYESTTSTSTSSGGSSAVQQGGGVSGKGQYPGTQSSAGSGGAFGLGANQTTTNYRYVSGAGGGGWYGGGRGYSDSYTSYVNYSGGGSGFVNTAANASYRPSGYTGLQLDSGSTIAGDTSHPSTSGGTETGHSGNGYARITVL